MSKGGKVKVFVDGQVFAAAGFNFSSRNFRKLAALGQKGQIRLLMPEATVMECRRRIERTHSSSARLIGRFELFLKRSDAVMIPFRFAANELFELLESGRCPLKRRRLLSEAAPMLSLLQWCAGKSKKVYVIGAHDDLRAICAANSAHLVYVERLEDFVNRFSDG